MRAVLLLLAVRTVDSETALAEARALVKLTELFKRDPAAAERLVGAAKAAVTPAVDRFSWADAQRAMRCCMNHTTPVIREDRYAYWRSSSALGNALNGWMHMFLYALASGRQLVAGDGLSIELLCGTHGAFLCGVPYRGKSWLKTRTPPSVHGRTKLPVFITREVDPAWSNSSEDVHVAPLRWYDYQGSGSATMRGAPSSERRRKQKLIACYPEALRCPAGLPRASKGREECLMIRAMQLLLPGSRLRPEFASASIVEAKRRWRGDLGEFERVVAPRDDVLGDNVFYDPPLQSDAITRWEGALHVRGMPPDLEHARDGRDHFDAFRRNLANGSFATTWPCVAQRARHAAKHTMHERAPTSFFVASDMSGLCEDARRALEDASLRIVCMDLDPVHLTKGENAPVSNGSDDGLDGHQAVVLDWYLLQRSRWLAPMVRRGAGCYGKHGGAKTVGGLYDVASPGQSFFGWALAASGLGQHHRKGPPPSCGCGIEKLRVSAFGRPRLTAPARRILQGETTEAQALAELTQLFKRDPVAAERLVATAQAAASGPAAAVGVDLAAITARMAADGFTKHKGEGGTYYARPGNPQRYRSRFAVAKALYPGLSG